MAIKKTKFKIYLYIVISMVCWSFSFIWTRTGLESFQPITLISLRLILASIFLYIFAKISGKFIRIEKKDLKIFILLAFFEPFMYYVGETYGLTRVEPTLASVIISTIPVFAPIFAFVFLGEKISILNFIGIALSILGVFLVVYKPDGSTPTDLKGIALLLLAVLSSIGYTIILRKIPEKYSATNIVFYQSLISLLFFIPTFLIVDFPSIHQLKISADSIQALLLLTIFASVIAFVLFADAVRLIGVARTQIFVNLIPVFTAVFSWILLHEYLNIIQWLGILVVIFGLFISQRRKAKKS